MKKIWTRIETWLLDNTPPDEEKIPLPPGVSEVELQKAEATFGFRLPKDVRDSYKCHNGTYRPDARFYTNRSNRLCLWDGGAAALMPIGPLPHVTKTKQRLTPQIIESWTFMKEMLEEGIWDGMVNEPNGPIKICWWNVKWVPLTDNEGGDHICLDMDPAKGGKKGQIIDWWHEGGQGATKVYASDFRQWLTEYADELESGKYVFDGTSVTEKL